MNEFYIQNAGNLASARYDVAQERLYITFTNGNTKGHLGVPESVWNEFVKTLSKSWYYKLNIEGRYPVGV